MKNLAVLGVVLSFPLLCQAGSFEAGDVFATVAQEGALKFSRNGQAVAELRRGSDETVRFIADGKALAEIREQRDSQSYPRKVEVQAHYIRQTALPAGRDSIDMTYVEVAPAFSIQSEAAEEGFSGYAAEFKRETGRDLRKGYEVSGRVRGGVLAVNGAKAAEFYTGFQRNKDGSYKEHHRGDTLEHADVISYGTSRAFVSYRCGCHGFSEFNPKIVVGGYEYSIELKSNGDWINIGKGALFRKPRKFIIRDLAGDSFGGIDISYNGETMSQATYRFFAGSTEIARATIDGSDTRLELAKGSTDVLAKLDVLLAMMPTQVIRGDGVRDSLLGQVETMIDWIRFQANPSADRLADVVSKTDAATAPAKVIALLSANSARFKAKRAPDEAPPGVICTPDGCKYLPEAN